MNLKEVLKMADDVVFDKTGEHLDNLQEAILRGTMQGETYTNIAKEVHANESYVRDVGSKLWKMLSEELGENVKKSNFRVVIQKLKNSNILNFEEKVIVKGRGSFNICGESLHPPVIPNKNPTNEDISNSQFTKISYQDLSEMPDLDTCYDRTYELKTLTNWILQEKCRLITITGISGIGKTTLAVKLVKEIKNIFEYVIWYNLELYHNFTDFQNKFIEFFTESDSVAFSTNQHNLLSVTKYLQKYRCLIILDGIHNLFCQGELAGKYQANCQEYRLFFQEIAQLSHQSSVLLIGREEPREMSQFTRQNTLIQNLQLTGLELNSAKKLFEEYGLEIDNIEPLIDCYQGNPFWLKSVASLIQQLGNKATELLVNNIILLPEDLKDNLDQQFNRLSAIEKEIMLLLATENKPINLSKLAEHNLISTSDLFNVLQSLLRRCLIDQQGNFYDITPVLKQYQQLSI